jgi:hypothetical protein
MLTNVEIIYREGIPKDTVMLTVPKTNYWLECRKWLNGSFRVTVVNPMTTYRKEVWRSIPEAELDRIFNQLCRMGSFNSKTTGKHLLQEIRRMYQK